MDQKSIKSLHPMRIFANKQGVFYLPINWIKDEGRLPRKKNGCTHFGPNEKEIYTHYHNPDLLDDME